MTSGLLTINVAISHHSYARNSQLRCLDPSLVHFARRYVSAVRQGLMSHGSGPSDMADIEDVR
jgi:hypothetical protein